MCVACVIPLIGVACCCFVSLGLPLAMCLMARVFWFIAVCSARCWFVYCCCLVVVRVVLRVVFVCVGLVSYSVCVDVFRGALFGYDMPVVRCDI